MNCPVGTDVPRAAALLRRGALVAFPTETVYGLGADALDPAAVARIFEAKERPAFDPLIVHIAESARLDELAADVSESARRLTERFWPGPLTLVLPKTEAVPDIVTSGLPTVAVRVPDHPLALDLLEAAGRPVAAPSANRFGRVSPTTAAHVAEQLGERIDYILDGGPCRVGLESTVLDMTSSPPRLLRPGGLPAEEIEAVIGHIALPETETPADTEAKPAPGMLSRHYAPATPLIVEADPRVPLPPGRLGLLTLTPPTDPSPFAAVEVLSATGALTEAAARFFAALRRLDAQGIDCIVARPFPERGLGRAMNDRLRRAAARSADQ